MTDAQKIYAIVLAILSAGTNQGEITQPVMARADQIMHLAFKAGAP